MKKSKFHFVLYCELCGPKIKRFKTIKAMDKFISDFKKKYPDKSRNSDFWIDFAVTNVSGDIVVHDPAAFVED